MGDPIFSKNLDLAQLVIVNSPNSRREDSE